MRKLWVVFLSLCLVGCAERITNGIRFGGGGPSLTFSSPMLTRLGMNFPGKWISLSNNNEAWCDVFVSGAFAGTLGPGDIGTAKIHRIPFPMTIPVVFSCRASESAKSPIGIDYTMLSVSNDEYPVLWTSSRLFDLGGVVVDQNSLTAEHRVSQETKLDLRLGPSLINGSLLLVFVNLTPRTVETRTYRVRGEDIGKVAPLGTAWSQIPAGRFTAVRATIRSRNDNRSWERMYGVPSCGSTAVIEVFTEESFR